MKQLVALTLLVAGCTSIAHITHAPRSGSFSMPDVTGQTADQAKASLASAGITGTIYVDNNYVCHDDHVATAQVCSTQPPAGQPTGADLPVTLHLRPAAETKFVVPDLSGMTADQARAALIRLGQDPDRIDVETLPNDPGFGCQAGRVCKQSPAPGNTGYAQTPVLLDIGPAGAGTSGTGAGT